MIHPLTQKDLFELIAVGAVVAVLAVFFARKKSFRLFLIYTFIVALQVGAVVAHRLYYMPLRWFWR